MNTILITGTAKMNGNHVNYDVYIWASKEGDQIQMITNFKSTFDGYMDLWKEAKERAVNYLHEPRMDDGAYTQFLDHITIIN